MTPRLYTFLLLGGIFLLAGTQTQATMSDYSFYQGSGTPTDMTGYTQVMAANQDEVRVGPNSLGFTFNFDGVDYTTYNLSSNGWLKFGTATTSADLSNAFDAGAQYPLIAPFWDDLRTYPDSGHTIGYIRYKMTGTAPNRVVTFEFLMKYWTGNGNGPWKYQLRLYETSNRIEIIFLSMPQNYNTSATIGAATSTTNFLSITPGSPATASTTAANHSINLNNMLIPANTMYTLVRCQPRIEIAGNTSQGGTTQMADGDALLVDQQSVVGEGLPRNPFTIVNGLTQSACDVRTYSYTLSGPNAAEYSIAPTGGSLGIGASATPTIIFTPAGLGERTATLTVADDAGFRRSYTLKGEGIPRIYWISNVSQGGTALIADGDELLQGVEIRRNSSQDFRPITIRNAGQNAAAPAASITFVLDDPHGQYDISTTSVQLAAGQTVTPVITFAPTIPGEQRATLRVTADGETRTYTLVGYSLAPAAEFSIEGASVYAGQNYFNRAVLCVGESVTLPLEIRNVNRMDVVISDLSVFATENVIRQGAPRFPVLRDAFGNRVRTVEYAVTEVPGTASPSANRPVSLPLVIRPGETRTLWVTYLPARPGSRFGRMFIATNGENFTGTALGSFDPGAGIIPQEGMFVLDLYGKGLGATIAGTSTNGRPEAITFTPTEVRQRTTASTIVENRGDCDLKISRRQLEIVSGDVNDFSLVSVLPNTPVVADYYVLAPGARDSIVATFTPQTFGSRRASIRLVSNDSTFGLTGVASVGDCYIDLYGLGRVGIEVPDLTINPAVIGAENSFGVITLINTKGTVIEITGVTLVDPNGEFRKDPARPWPGMPLVIGPGEKVELGVMLAPAATAAPGGRQATVRVTLRDGDTATAVIRGYAGTRTLLVAPGALFMNRTVPVGGVARALVGLTNTGTLPVRLNQPVLSGASPGDYMVGRLGRMVIEPGGTELIEVTYAPQNPGTSSATLTFGSNSTGGDLVVQLGGEGTGTSIHSTGGSSSNLIGGDERGTAERNGVTTGVTGILAVTGVAPNPARESFAVEYALASDRPAELLLYAPDGRLLRRIDLDSHQGIVSVSTEEVPTGVYLLVLKQGGALHSSAVTVLK